LTVKVVETERENFFRAFFVEKNIEKDYENDFTSFSVAFLSSLGTNHVMTKFHYRWRDKGKG